MRNNIFATLMAGLFLSAPAVADEAWTTEFGTAYWDIDMDGQAIFALPTDTGTDVRIYLPGFTIDTPRGAHWGYWIMPGDDLACDSTMTGADGVTSGNWGSVLLTFDEVDFPSSWTAIFGRCFEELEYSIRAEVD